MGHVYSCRQCAWFKTSYSIKVVTPQWNAFCFNITEDNLFIFQKSIMSRRVPPPHWLLNLRRNKTLLTANLLNLLVCQQLWIKNWQLGHVISLSWTGLLICPLWYIYIEAKANLTDYTKENLLPYLFANNVGHHTVGLLPVLLPPHCGSQVVQSLIQSHKSYGFWSPLSLKPTTRTKWVANAPTADSVHDLKIHASWHGLSTKRVCLWASRWFTTHLLIKILLSLSTSNYELKS